MSSPGGRRTPQPRDLIPLPLFVLDLIACSAGSSACRGSSPRCTAHPFPTLTSPIREAVGRSPIRYFSGPGKGPAPLSARFLLEHRGSVETPSERRTRTGRSCSGLGEGRGLCGLFRRRFEGRELSGFFGFNLRLDFLHRCALSPPAAAVRDGSQPSPAAAEISWPRSRTADRAGAPAPRPSRLRAAARRRPRAPVPRDNQGERRATIRVTADSLSTSRILRMGNLTPGMPRSLWKGAKPCHFADHPTTPVTPVQQAGRDPPEQVDISAAESRKLTTFNRLQIFQEGSSG